LSTTHAHIQPPRATERAQRQQQHASATDLSWDNLQAHPTTSTHPPRAPKCKGGPHPSSKKKKEDAGIGMRAQTAKTAKWRLAPAARWLCLLLTMSTTVLIPAGDLKAYTAACLVAAGSLKGNAELVAEVSKVVPCSANLVTRLAHIAPFAPLLVWWLFLLLGAGSTASSQAIYVRWQCSCSRITCLCHGRWLEPCGKQFVHWCRKVTNRVSLCHCLASLLCWRAGSGAGRRSRHSIARSQPSRLVLR
jgi:hypothetical protein